MDVVSKCPQIFFSQDQPNTIQREKKIITKQASMLQIENYTKNRGVQIPGECSV